MKKYFNISNILLWISFIITTTLAVVFWSKNTFGVWISTVLGILASKSASSGKWFTFLFDIVSYIFYLQICMQERFWGEFTLSIAIIIFNIFCIKEWKKHSENNLVKINDVNKNEIKFIGFVGSLLLIIYAIFLQKINSNLAILNSICTVSFLLGNYFCYRRSVLQFYCLIIYEISFILIWGISAMQGNYSSLMFIVGGTCELIYDVLGIVTWKKLQNIQKIKKCKTLYFLR